MRKNISSGTIWEKEVGYSRAVRIGTLVEVSGTVAMDGDVMVGENDVEVQAKFIFQKIERVLQEAGATLQDVVRTRMYVTDIQAHWEIIGRVHGSFFANILPVTTMVEVSGLIDPRMLLEVEVTAVVKEQH
jgi:enamine deaminase RidA (YjgF/YER057c/UK114 family)